MAEVEVGVRPTRKKVAPPAQEMVGLPAGVAPAPRNFGDACAKLCTLCCSREMAYFSLTAFFLLPVGVIALSFFFGALLAVVEEWTVMDGFYIVVGNLCGLGTPLVDLAPENDFGKLCEVIIAVWSLSVAGTFIGLLGGMNVVTLFTTVLNGEAEAASELNLVALQEAVLKMKEIDFKAFKVLMLESGYQGEEESLKQLFDSFDIDGSGALDQSEVDCIATKMSASMDGSASDAQLVNAAMEEAESYKVTKKLDALSEKVNKMEANIEAIMKAVQQ